MVYDGLEAALTNERNAIVKFLDEYWEIKVTGENSLPEIVDYILREGTKYGVWVQENKVEERLKWATLANEPIMKFERITKEDEFVADFCFSVSPVKSKLKKMGIGKVMPKNYKEFCATNPDDYEGCSKTLPYGGTELHYSIGVTSLSLGQNLNLGNIYHSSHSQDRSPLEEFIGAIYRQGMNLGVLAVEEKSPNPLDAPAYRKELLESLGIKNGDVF